MTNEERDLITHFIERVSGSATSSGFAGSVPSSQASLPPVDHDADALIADLFQRHPEARYRITQLAFVQEQALNAAQQRIQAMQAQLQQVQQAGGQQQGGASPWGAGQSQPQHRGFFGSLFGGGSQQSSAPPPRYSAPPQYAPQYAAPPGMFQSQGSGFLGGALQTAAGVAGGLVAGEALMNLFEGHHGGGFFGNNAAMQGGGFAAAPMAESPWGGANPVADPYDQGGALKTDPANDPYAAGQGVSDNSGWAPAPDQAADQGGWQPASDDSSWQQAPDQGGDAGGWDSGSNADDGGWTDSSSDA